MSPPVCRSSTQTPSCLLTLWKGPSTDARSADPESLRGPKSEQDNAPSPASPLGLLPPGRGRHAGPAPKALSNTSRKVKVLAPLNPGQGMRGTLTSHEERETRPPAVRTHAFTSEVDTHPNCCPRTPPAPPPGAHQPLRTPALDDDIIRPVPAWKERHTWAYAPGSEWVAVGGPLSPEGSAGPRV